MLLFYNFFVYISFLSATAFRFKVIFCDLIRSWLLITSYNLLLFDLCTEDIFSSVFFFLAVYFLSFSLYTASANEHRLCLQFILSDDRSYRLGKNRIAFSTVLWKQFSEQTNLRGHIGKFVDCTESIFQYSSILSCSVIKKGFVTRYRNGSEIFTMDDKFEKRSQMRFFLCSGNLLSRHTKLFVKVLKKFLFYFLIQSHIFSSFFYLLFLLFISIFTSSKSCPLMFFGVNVV